MEVTSDGEAVAAVGVVVCLGAGNFQGLQEFLELRPDSLYLVEPNPKIAKQLESDFSDMSNVHVLSAALSDRAGERRLVVYNVGHASSFHRPTKLNDYYPGLRVREELLVGAMTYTALFANIEFASNKRHWLLIDSPGEEASILECLISNDILHRFDQLVLRCAKEALYEGSVPADELLALLDMQSYEVKALDRKDDPDRPVWTLRLNRLAIECKQLRAALNASEAEETRLRERQKNLENRIRVLESDSDEQDRRRAQMNDEMVRAEAQIELIKDVLLREPGL
jgi:FkbM family methyltransferase